MSVELRPVIDVPLVAALVREQFPQWAGLDVRPVDHDGWDNRTFRLGDSLTVRLPSAAGYVPCVEKEQRWLPVLAPRLPLPIPTPLGVGTPSGDYPFPWSIHAWIDGAPAATAPPSDQRAFAVALAEFLNVLHGIDDVGGPAAGAHSFFRGADPVHYDDETRAAVGSLVDVEAAAALDVWDAALAATSTGRPAWFHGDVAAGNLLVRDGRLVAVIDFGTSGVGDPACDTTVAWTLLTGAGREAFRAALDADDATWARGRGWALWKALITLEDPRHSVASRRVLDDVLAEHAALDVP